MNTLVGIDYSNKFKDNKTACRREFWCRISLKVNTPSVKDKLEEKLQYKNCFAEALASAFALLKVKHLCVRTSSLEFLSLDFLLIIQTSLFLYCVSGKME